MIIYTRCGQYKLGVNQMQQTRCLHWSCWQKRYKNTCTQRDELKIPWGLSTITRLNNRLKQPFQTEQMLDLKFSFSYPVFFSDGQGHSYDLSPLAMDSRNWEVETSTDNSGKSFYINVCRSLVQMGGQCAKMYPALQRTLYWKYKQAIPKKSTTC